MVSVGDWLSTHEPLQSILREWIQDDLMFAKEQAEHARRSMSLVRDRVRVC